MADAKPLVSERRRYLVTTVAQAKEITVNWLTEIELNHVVSLGLPEVDDRYHIWRIPLLRQIDAARIGELAIDAYNTAVLHEKSTRPEMLGARLLKKDEARAEKKRKVDSKYPISTLRNTIGMGDLQMTLGYVQDQFGKTVPLNWEDITRLTTAIGSATLTIRGSDKSIYGKLFERLILGSFLSILGFERVNPAKNIKTEKVFWLSDSSDLRESDATLLLSPGKLVRFDIGFIGPGNSEISKDKLSRYVREIGREGTIHNSVTFIIVDRLQRICQTDDDSKNQENVGIFGVHFGYMSDGKPR